jgi:hypothetical protein
MASSMAAVKAQAATITIIIHTLGFILHMSGQPGPFLKLPELSESQYMIQYKAVGSVMNAGSGVNGSVRARRQSHMPGKVKRCS